MLPTKRPVVEFDTGWDDHSYGPMARRIYACLPFVEANPGDESEEFMNTLYEFVANTFTDDALTDEDREYLISMLERNADEVWYWYIIEDGFSYKPEMLEAFPKRLYKLKVEGPWDLPHWRYPDSMGGIY